jgi:hypothetical protein
VEELSSPTLYHSNSQILVYAEKACQGGNVIDYYGSASMASKYNKK